MCNVCDRLREHFVDYELISASLTSAAKFTFGVFFVANNDDFKIFQHLRGSPFFLLFLMHANPPPPSLPANTPGENISELNHTDRPLGRGSDFVRFSFEVDFIRFDCNLFIPFILVSSIFFGSASLSMLTSLFSGVVEEEIKT